MDNFDGVLKIQKQKPLKGVHLGKFAVWIISFKIIFPRLLMILDIS